VNAGAQRARLAIGVSLKMYLGPHRTREWIADVLDRTAGHPALTRGAAELFVLPAFTDLTAVLDATHGSAIAVGAQDLFWADEGPYTGEVSGSALRTLGCRYAEIGHAERRRLFGEDDRVVAAKLAAALRNQLQPVLCVGETEALPAAAAADACAGQLDAALAAADRLPGPITVAYEPVWAIGAAQPADPDHVAEVCAALRRELRDRPDRAGSRVIYGGSAGPGLLTGLGPAVDGLFLGRFAHEPAALAQVLDEAHALAAGHEVPA
jgi:triosephosphate isomerase